ncbi:helix-turn-helix domain-containing protein [Halomonas koreensis]|uniref:DJ-1/PfpI family protein n=1 Tax=Halomonas koreensis TaxID=245385 RepID=A0ABU1FX92_9GAMM|nr:hypothetical protein [Halomonas koreensis]MDR5865305.1 hypothetical protein [Halomonas koreensis]
MSPPETGALRVGVLMLPGQVPLDLVGPLQVLHGAERLAGGIAIRYFGPRASLDWLGPLTLAGIEPLPEPLEPLDLLVVPGQYRRGIDPLVQPGCVAWLRRHAGRVATLMGICSGSLLMAEAGAGAAPPTIPCCRGCASWPPRHGCRAIASSSRTVPA